MLLNTVEKTLSYQVYKWNGQMPAIQGIFPEEILGHKFYCETRKPARVIRNAKNGFVPQTLITKEWEPEIVFSYGIRLSDSDMEKILPLCNVMDFEPYRDRKMSIDDKGYEGCRDTVEVQFTGISDSYVPKLELPMYCHYDEEHTWPSERLYQYLLRKYFSGKKKLRKWVLES